MRFIIYGAGGVGGTVGARLFQHGQEVLLIARGEHFQVMQQKGLTFRTPVETQQLKIPVASHPRDISFSKGDVVILTMKSQHTWAALLDLVAAAGPDIPVICCQNGVANERMALRLFNRVYGMVVMLPANHMEPGVVECSSATRSGILDAGCYPRGTDATIRAVAEIFEGANMVCRADENIMRWKYQKLLRNLNNALQAICQISEATRPISRKLLDEALAVYQAAGIEAASRDEEAERRGDLIQVKSIDGQQRVGGSSWQSLVNAKGDIESDYLNGEIALLGRLHGVATPANMVLQNLGTRAAREGWQPGSMDAAGIQKEIDLAAAELTASRETAS